MKFFIPAANDQIEAEQIYQAIAKFNSAPITPKRIYALAWEHNGQRMSCRVGEPLHSYFGTGREPVLAILDCGSVYQICTPNRGGLRGEPVLAGNRFGTDATYFDEIAQKTDI